MQPLPALLVTAFLLAGCSDSPTDEDPLVLDGHEDPPLQEAIGASPTPWQLGQSFDFTLTWAPLPQLLDMEQGPFTAVVHDDQMTAWGVAPQQDWAAKVHATFGLPGLGTFQKDDLASTLVGAPFEPYRFPLEDGKTWESHVPVFSVYDAQVTEVDLLHTVTLDEAISTPAGPMPGFAITADMTDGTRLYEYDYVPGIGWWTHLHWLDTVTDDPADRVMTLTLDAVGDATGTVFTTVSDERVFTDAGWAPNTENPGESYFEPMPATTFTITEEGTHVYGLLISAAFVGANQAMLVDPNGQHHDCQSTGTNTEATIVYCWMTVPAVPGQWSFANVGAGAAFVGGAWLFEVKEQTAAIGAGAA